jgi:hypothetical protein
MLTLSCNSTKHESVTNCPCTALFTDHLDQVIPEIERQGAGKKAAYEVPLGRKTSKVNLYSSLDKSIVVSTPRKGGNSF